MAEELTPRERVRRAARFQPVDRIPRGEILVEGAFLDICYPQLQSEPWRSKMTCLARDTGLDLISLPIAANPGRAALREVQYWARQSTWFVAVLIDGVFWHAGDPLSFERYLLAGQRKSEEFAALCRDKQKRVLETVERCLAAGADGCIVGDDLAYDRGPFMAPTDLDTWIFPPLREIGRQIKEWGGVAFLHSCGNLTSLLGSLVTLGFDVLHGLAPAAGNDPAAARELTRGRLALMGGFDVDGRDPARVAENRRALLPRLSPGGGYILSTSSGLSGATEPDAFRALYDVG